MLTRVPADADVAQPPRVAFAIGAKLGPAVARNRVRRRLRSLFATAVAEGRMPAGAYLAVVRPEGMSAPYAQLEADVATSLAKLSDMAGGPR
jgi:ribonuclease P protein component